MAWTLTVLTPEDRDLILGCLRADADRREKAAKESSLRLVTDGEEGRTLPVKAQRSVRQLHADAETLRSIAWDLEHQRDVPAVVEAGEVLEEERAATYPPPALVEAPVQDALSSSANLVKMPSQAAGKGQRRTPRSVKFVEFRDEDEERAAAMAAHPAGKTTPREDQS